MIKEDQVDMGHYKSDVNIRASELMDKKKISSFLQRQDRHESKRKRNLEAVMENQTALSNNDLKFKPEVLSKMKVRRSLSEFLRD